MKITERTNTRCVCRENRAHGRARKRKKCVYTAWVENERSERLGYGASVSELRLKRTWVEVPVKPAQTGLLVVASRAAVTSTARALPAVAHLRSCNGHRRHYVITSSRTSTLPSIMICLEFNPSRFVTQYHLLDILMEVEMWI